jgi:uncharacterized C2H2 Zn-finger protein
MSSTARTGGKIATQWRCNHCKKYLSSKRSYREHMNVHSERRPFQCDECEYAAASQMTLRRHRLRLHIPRSEWGYPCPYCSEVYMEPASYEQHVSRRHFGQSCTYGCPHQSCNFTSKSSRHFLEHISRHHMVIISSQSNMPPFPDNLAPDSIKASYYLIDDEIGSGYGKPPLEAEIRRYDDVLSLTTAKTRVKPNTKVKSANTVPTAKIVSPFPNQSRARRKITIEEEPKSLSTEISCEEAEDVTEIEEIIYEEIPEIDEVVEEEHYYEIVDENGISIDNQFYEYDPEADYGTEFIDESMDNEVVEIKEAVANKTSVQIDKNNEKRLLPDGQVDIDLD